MILSKRLVCVSILLLSIFTLKAQATEGDPINIPWQAEKPPIVLKLPLYRLKRSPPCCYSVVQSCCEVLSCGEPSLAARPAIPTEEVRVPEINSLEEIPTLLGSELARFGTSKPKVFVFFDWDDTLTQREWQLKGVADQLFDFRYLSSPEAPRQLQSTIEQTMEEMGGGNPGKQEIIQQAFEYFNTMRRGRTNLTYRAAHPNLPCILAQLKESDITVKVCSGLGLGIDSERSKLLEELGLGTQDYIHATNKARAMVSYIADAHTEADPSQASQPAHYFAVLVDNYLPDGPDFFYSQFEQEVSRIRKSLGDIRITSLLVKDTRFMREVGEQLTQLRREIGYTLELYRPSLARQKEEAERRLAALAQSESHLAEIVATIE